MKYSTLKKILRKYEHGTATDAERYVVERWYDSFGKGTAGVPGLEDEESREAMRKRMLHQVLHPAVPVRWYHGKWLRVAAILLLVSAAALGLYLNEYPYAEQQQGKFAMADTITTGERQLKKIMLPDSSVVWLNAESQLRVMPEYGAASRQLELRGEAFFEVKPDSLHPLEVATQGLVVRVLGTSFNVSAYDALRDVKVSVSTGKVRVSDTAYVHSSELIAGQALRYDKSSKTYAVGNSSIADNHTWTTGKIVLERAGFEELAQAMRNLYGIQLTTINKQVKSFRYNLTLRSTQTETDALGMICTILKTSYKKEANGAVRIY